MSINFEELKQKNSIFDVLQRLGIEVRETNGTRAIKCPNPNHEDRHPSCVVMSKVNRVECKSCGFKGDVIEIVQAVKGIDKVQACEWIDPTCKTEAVKPEPIDPTTYLEKKRLLTPETIKKFNLRMTSGYHPNYTGSDKRQFDRVTIPYPGGEKYRWLNIPSDFARYTFKKDTPANLYGINKNAKEVILTAGEFDMMKAWQETGIAAWTKPHGERESIEPQLARFKNVTKIYICYDNDKTGLEGAKKDAAILGVDRCHFVELPGGVKDITEYFIYPGNTADTFKALLATAKPASVNESSFFERVKKAQEEPGEMIPTGIKIIDEVLKGGLRTGNSYLLGGYKKCGKTGFLGTMTNYWLTQNYKVSYFDTELGAGELNNRLVALYNNFSFNEAEGNKELQREYAEMFDSNFFYSASYDEELQENDILSTKKVLAKMKENIDKGAQVQIFDNLTYFMDLETKGLPGWRIASAFMKDAQQLAKKTNTIVVFVIHSKEDVVYTETADGVKNLIKNDETDKMFEDSYVINRKPSSKDLLLGTAAHSYVSGIFLLWRPLQALENSFESRKAELILEDFRHAKNDDKILLLFNGSNYSFTQREGNTRVNIPMQPAPILENKSDFIPEVILSERPTGEATMFEIE